MFGNIQLCPSVNDLAVDLRWWRIWRWFHQICPSLFHPLCEIYQYHWQQSSPRASCYHHHAWSWYSALRFESFNIISPHMPHCGQLPPFSSCAIKHFSRKHLACRCEQFQSTTRVSTLEQGRLSWFLVGSWLHCVDSDAGECSKMVTMECGRLRCHRNLIFKSGLFFLLNLQVMIKENTQKSWIFDACMRKSSKRSMSRRGDGFPELNEPLLSFNQ